MVTTSYLKRRWILQRAIILSLLFFWSTGVASSEEKPGPDGNQGNLARVLQNPAVHRELGLSADQVANTRAASQRILERHREDFVRALAATDKKDSIRKVFLAVTNETFGELASVLAPDQLARLKQIELQCFGARAFGRPNVQDALELTPEQITAFEKLGDDLGGKMRAIAIDRSLSPAHKEHMRSAVNQELSQAIQGTLNQKQRKVWAELIGQPFRP